MILNRADEVTPDPTEEIKAIRHRLGAKFNYDLTQIFADIQRRQQESGRTYINLPPRKPMISKAARRDDRTG
ncbi:MAG: hypothetical protein SGJ20_18520 [Planctomycetota bacterium]|nr:hypothetical protein [Planctomycetota bacterium]